MQAGVDAKGSMPNAATAPTACANGHAAPLAAPASHPAGTPAPAGAPAAGGAPDGLAAGPGRPPLEQAHSQYSASPPAKSEEAAKASVVDVLDRASMAGQRRPLEEGPVPAPEPGAPAVRPANAPSSSLLLWWARPKHWGPAPQAALRCAPAVDDFPNLLVRKGQSHPQSCREELLE